jgi:hypothetical protein
METTAGDLILTVSFQMTLKEPDTEEIDINITFNRIYRPPYQRQSPEISGATIFFKPRSENYQAEFNAQKSMVSQNYPNFITLQT